MFRAAGCMRGAGSSLEGSIRNVGVSHARSKQWEEMPMVLTTIATRVCTTAHALCSVPDSPTGDAIPNCDTVGELVEKLDEKDDMG